MTAIPVERIYDVARASEQMGGDDEALVSEGRAWTRAELATRVDRCAARFQASGMSGPVGVSCRQSPELLVLVLGAIRAGLIPVLMSPRWPRAARHSALVSMRSAHVVSDDPEERSPGAGVAVHQLRTFLSATQSGRPGQQPQRSPDDPALAVFTSGSAGEPRPVLLSGMNLWASAAGVLETVRVGPGDRWVMSLPLWHVGGLGILYRCLLSRAAVVFPAPGDSLPGSMVRERVSHASLVPTQLRRSMLAGASEVLAGLRVILLGGGPVPAALVQDALAAGVPVYPTYGLSEMASAVTIAVPAGKDGGTVSAGSLLPHRELRIDETGEICVRGQTLFLGYGLPSKTSRPVDSDGWFKTGDAGRLDAAERLHVLGRLDDMFVSGGENIYPAVIESALMSIEDIIDATVVAVPDDDFGRRPFAFIRTDAPEADVDRIKTALREFVPGYMVPADVQPYPSSDRGLKWDRARLQSLACQIRSGA